MKLGDRIRAAQEKAAAAEGDSKVTKVIGSEDPIADFKQRVQDELFKTLGPDVFNTAGDEPTLRAMVIEELEKVIETVGVALSDSEREQLANEISENILGYGPVQQLLDDQTVTEIMVNSTNPIYV